MRRDEDTDAPPSSSEPVPSPDPSDPDAEMYAAIRARPNWVDKPAVRQAVKELSEGLRTGEDIFFWDVSRLRPIPPSDAEEHRIFTLPPSAGGLSDTLPSGRVIVEEGHGQSGTARQKPPPRSVPRWCLAAVFFGVALLSAAFTLLVLHLSKGDRSLAPMAPAALSSPSCGTAGR